tara:strand:+ start:11 stop:355 length:345 start_codon:yes stop_codon:yes gene_type:complete
MSANLDNGVMLGALGSTYSRTATTIKPPTGMVIAAIQFLDDNTPTTLTAENPDKFFNLAHAANSLTGGSETVDEGSGGTTAATVTYKGGITIYGRWTVLVPQASGQGVICYFGY